jgi:multiple sugar transport system ATP-binding protein
VVETPCGILRFTAKSPSKSAAGDQVTIGVRPEYIRIDNGLSGVKAHIYSTLPSGMETIVKIRLGDQFLTLVVFGAVDYPTDTEVVVNFTGSNCILFQTEGGANLAHGEVAAL